MPWWSQQMTVDLPGISRAAGCHAAQCRQTFPAHLSRLAQYFLHSCVDGPRGRPGLVAGVLPQMWSTVNREHCQPGSPCHFLVQCKVAGGGAADTASTERLLLRCILRGGRQSSKGWLKKSPLDWAQPRGRSRNCIWGREGQR
jgi:hypothetical protein